MCFKKIFVLTAVALLCSCGGSSSKKPGIQALSSSEIKEAEQKANEGDPLAQLLMGRHKLYGLEEGKLGANPDLKRAFSYLNESAKNGNPEAMLLISRCYFDGAGTKRDEKMCARWLDEAISHGAPTIAKTRLAYFLLFKDKRNEALEVLKQAAAEGEPRAQDDIGRMQEGKYFMFRMAGNYSEAFNTYTTAANAGYAGAQSHLSEMYEKGRGTARDAQLAYDWSLKSIRSGDPFLISNHAFVERRHARETKSEKDQIQAYAYHLALLKLMERKLVKGEADDINSLKTVEIPMIKEAMSSSQVAAAENEQEKLYLELSNSITGPERFLREVESNFILTGTLPQEY